MRELERDLAKREPKVKTVEDKLAQRELQVKTKEVEIKAKEKELGKRERVCTGVYCLLASHWLGCMLQYHACDSVILHIP